MNLGAFALFLALGLGSLQAANFGKGKPPPALPAPAPGITAAAMPSLGAASPQAQAPLVPLSNLLRPIPGATGPQASAQAPGDSDTARPFAAGRRTFDGQARGAGSGDSPDSPDQQPNLGIEPSFEPPTLNTQPPSPPDRAPRKGNKRPQDELRLVLPGKARSGLMSIDSARGIDTALGIVRNFSGSKEYWKKFKPGVETDIRVGWGEESFFGRPTMVKKAYTKPLGKLTRKDFAGTELAYRIKAALNNVPIRDLRRTLLNELEQKRQADPAKKMRDPEVTLKTPLRVIKFKSYLELYRETNGIGSVPPQPKLEPRSPLEFNPEGRFKFLDLFKPRAVFLDLDSLEKPLSRELVADIIKLLKLKVYFVAFTKKSHAEAGSAIEKLIKPFSASGLGMFLSSGFLIVTHEGAAVSQATPAGGLVPVEAASFGQAELEVLRDAAQKAAEEIALPPGSLKEIPQAPLIFTDKNMSSRSKTPPHAPPARFELSLSKKMTEDAIQSWLRAFHERLTNQGQDVLARRMSLPDGKRSLVMQKRDILGSLPAVHEALADRFGLYLNPTDILVLSADKGLRAINPHLDFTDMTGLKGGALVENALGLLLGEHRETLPIDVTDSASRMASFTYNRRRYLSEYLLQEEFKERDINLFSGHLIHTVNDWLVWNLQNGRRPSPAEYEAELRRRWNKKLLEAKPVELPGGESMDGRLQAAVQGGLGSYGMVLRLHDRGEILIGTEISNFFIVKDLERRTHALKHRYIMRTIFDLIALRPDPDRPDHAKLVIYDFKTGNEHTMQNLERDLQVLTYALFAHQKWVGQLFRVPYFSGKKAYVIDGAQVELIYGPHKQAPMVTAWGREEIRRKIISISNRIEAAKRKLMGEPKSKKKKR